MVNKRMSSLPSVDPERLVEQLGAAIADGRPARDFVRAILADAWRGVHLGEAGVVAGWRGRLARLPADVRESPDVRGLDEVLGVAATALRDVRAGPAERRLAEDLLPILRILWERRGQPQRRADLYKLLGEQVRWSDANALSYPLERLADAELVLVTRQARQGGVSRHYALSALGVRVCLEVGLGEATVVSEDRSPAWARLREESASARRFDLAASRLALG